MISFITYKTLSNNQQIDLLLQFGVYLDITKAAGYLSIELYALGDFYVEIYFNTITEAPLFLRAFNSVRELEPYLASIEIDNIFRDQLK